LLLAVSAVTLRHNGTLNSTRTIIN